MARPVLQTGLTPPNAQEAVQKTAQESLTALTALTALAASTALTARVNDALPQTQCTRCGFPDCAAYAVAIAVEGAPINQCPPGGAEGIERLAAVTGQPVLALDPAHGLERPRAVAVIDENWCIGCTLCLDACPPDAIFGSNKMMHTVIEPYCTGCELCIPVCPVDCISLENVTGAQTGWAAWSADLATTARDRYQSRQRRESDADRSYRGEPSDRSSRAETTGQHRPVNDAVENAKRAKQAVISAALAKAKSKLLKK